LRQQPRQNQDFVVGPLVIQPQKDNAAVRMALPVNLLPEVFVVSDQYPVLGKGFRNQKIIVGPARLLIS